MPLFRRHTEPAMKHVSTDHNESSAVSSTATQTRSEFMASNSDLHVCYICDVNTRPRDCPLNRARTVNWVEKNMDSVTEGNREPVQPGECFLKRMIVNYWAGLKTSGLWAGVPLKMTRTSDSGWTSRLKLEIEVDRNDEPRVWYPLHTLYLSLYKSKLVTTWSISVICFLCDQNYTIFVRHCLSSFF